MESNFDLDINNYTMEDLLQFFKLENTFTLEDIVKKEYELATEILSVDNTRYNPKYKFDIINFIKSAKEVLTSHYHQLETVKEINKNIKKFVTSGQDERVGKIINPLSTHQAMENTIIPKYSINGYDYDVTTSIYLFNTAARNDYFVTSTSNCVFDLPTKWKDVISISLSSASIPNVMYAFSDVTGSNQIYIEEDGTGLAGLVILPEGNYTPFKIPIPPILPITEASFPDALELAINSTLGSGNRFKVDISLSTRKTRIYNTTNTFRMNLIMRKQSDKCSPYSSNIYVDYGPDYVPKKTEIPLYSYLQTMGFLMGYKETEYSGKDSYTSESVFTNTYSNYVFFVLEDHAGSQTASNTYGVLGEAGLLEGSILAIIPLNSGLFATTFDNNSNFIFKKREYFGPVDISRITIRLVNQRGNLIDLQDTDWNFSFQVKTLYNSTNPKKSNIRGIGPF